MALLQPLKSLSAILRCFRGSSPAANVAGFRELHRLYQHPRPYIPSLYVGTNGYVGIGTTAPATALEVRANAHWFNGIQIDNDNGTGGSPFLFFKDASGSWGIPFLAYPPAIRRVIYTTNTIEAVNRQVRKVIKTKGSFPSDDAALKLIYLAWKKPTSPPSCPHQNGDSPWHSSPFSLLTGFPPDYTKIWTPLIGNLRKRIVNSLP